jgi:hypothetical protein
MQGSAGLQLKLAAQDHAGRILWLFFTLLVR